MRTTDTNSPGGIAEWSELSEKLIRGLVHTLNNRITALSSFAQLISLGDDQNTSQQVLPEELIQLSTVSEHLRALCSEHLGAEALEIMPLLAEAVSLHRHHPMLRGIRCDVTMLSSLQPVRVPRWALLRLLLVLIDCGKSAQEEAGHDALAIGIRATEETVSLHFSFSGMPSAFADEMAMLCGGSIDIAGDKQTLLLPTLLELRRRERAAREAGTA